MEQLNLELQQQLNIIVEEAKNLIARFALYPTDLQWIKHFEDNALEWRLKNKSLLYPIRESVLRHGLDEFSESPIIYEQNDSKAVKEEISFWMCHLINKGFSSMLNSEVVYVNNTPLQIDASLLRTLYRDVYPYIYTELFEKYRNDFPELIKQVKHLGTGTFLDYLMAFIDSIRKDITLIDAESKRQALINLSLKNGEMYKLMSIGIHALLNLERGFITKDNYAFREEALESSNGRNYIDHGPNSPFRKSLESTPDELRRYMAQCPAANVFLEIMERIAISLPDNYLMGLQKES